MHNLIVALWRARVTFFWPIWITITIATIVVAWIVALPGPLALRSTKRVWGDDTLTPGPIHSRRTITGLVLGLFAVFLAAYITVSFSAEKFAFYDDIQLTLFSLRGHHLPPPIWPDSGRFFPLGLQEFNLLSHITRTIAGFHGLVIVQLSIFIGVLLSLDEELSIAARAALVSLVLIAPGIIISFTGLIYPERNVVLCLACLLMCVKRFERTQTPLWAAAAAACAQIMIYEKETASLVLLTFSIGRLLLRWWSAKQGDSDFHWLRSKESRLDLCLASFAVLFLSYYMAAMYPHPSTKYADDIHLSLPKLFGSYLRLDLLVWIFAIVWLARGYGIFRRRIAPSPLWDGLGLGGLVCFCAYLRLSIFRAYYLAPVEAIAVLYVGRFTILRWKQMRTWNKGVALSIACFVIIQYGWNSAFRVLERENVLRAKGEIARLVEARYGRGDHPERLYFPFASSWQVMEFGYYLDLQGIPIEDETATGAPGRKPVVMVARSVAKDGRCVKFWSMVCRAGAAPVSGDLVIILPDDDARFSDVTPYREVGEPLFLYDRWPAIPARVIPAVRMFSIASVNFAQREIPDRWLDASVTLWK